jgi:hypothetical protein
MLGAILSGIGIYSYAQGASAKELGRLTESNKQLIADEQRTSDIIRQQKQIIGSADDSITKLRKIISLIPDDK